jgi:hypothetical protein
LIHGINGRLPLFFIGLAEAVLDVHSAHTNFAAKKTSAATADWIKSLPYRTKGNNLYYRVVSHLQKKYIRLNFD